ncbi:MAG: transposase [bacterium]
MLVENLWKDELYKYIMGIIKNNQHNPLVINGVPDHVHVLVSVQVV